jgi:hypothetical protein
MATRALLVDLININNMCGGRMTVEEALHFKLSEDMTFDEEYRMMDTNPYENQPRERGFGEWPSYDESGVRDDVLDAFGV